MIEEQIEKLRTLQESYDVLATSIETQLPAIADKIDNIDLTPIENKVDEGVSALSTKIDNIDLSAVESKVQEESAAIQAKIDNIELPEIDTSALAKQGDNQDATNTAIYALLSQFGESVLQEVVTIILNCQDSVDWSEYAVEVTMANGSVQYVPITENGTCSFSIRLGQEYSVQLPVIGAYIAPQVKTYTAMTTAREIYWSYVVSGVFGLDELGRRYSIEQIEALQDKSIIKYGGYTDDILENAVKSDGTFGCGFMWEINDRNGGTLQWASENIEFSTELLPFLDRSNILQYDGESGTRYILSEGIRLGVSTPAATWCVEQTISINGEVKQGFMIKSDSAMRLNTNKTSLVSLYNACGLPAPIFTTNSLWSCTQGESGLYASFVGAGFNTYYKKHLYTTVAYYSLPK